MGLLFMSHRKAGTAHMLLHAPYTSVDILCIAWCLVSIPVFLLLPPVDELLGYSQLLHSILWAFVNIAVAVAIVAMRTLHSAQLFDAMENPWLAWLHGMFADLYVIIMLALISHQGSLMSALIWHGQFFDNDVQVVEHAAWSCQPSVELHRAINSLVVGEYLMSMYSLWPLVLLGSLLVLWRGEDDEQITVTSGILLVTMFACVVLAISFPVKGPRHTLEQIDAAALGHWSPHLVLFMEDHELGNHISLPSQRTALAISLWLSAMRYNLGLACVQAIFIPAIVVASIYGGLNYTLDVVVGVFVASIMYSLGGSAVLCMHNQTVRRREQWHGGGCCKLDLYDLSHDSDLKYATEVDRLTSGDMFI